VPVLAISSCLDEVAARRGQLHQMKDQRAAAGTVCDWSEEARTASAAYGLIDRALAEFTATRPRPKHVQVLIALLETAADAAPTPLARMQRPGITEAGLELALRMLKGARRPLFIFGGGARHGADAARKVVRALGAASFTSCAGRGIVGPDDPLHFGSTLARPGSVAVLAQADAVVAVGTELAEVDLWRADLGHLAPMVRVDLDPESLGDAARAEFHVQADAADFLAALYEALQTDPPQKSDWTATEVAAARSRWRAETAAQYPGILPVADALRACLPDGTMIYSDMTQFAYASKEVWPMDRPGHWHHPFGFGTLGYALPAAIGGAVARRADRLPTLAIAGDYGFQYTVQELGLAVELGLPLPIVLWDNGKLGAIEASMIRAQIAPNAVIARNPDFCRLAEAYGAASSAPQTLAQMQDAVRAAFAADGPTLIRVRADIAG
jgi:acetolactate synthase-1/2/3 large subunit/5-guanidino-2-oxopentanoate decarboxylase